MWAASLRVLRWSSVYCPFVAISVLMVLPVSYSMRMGALAVGFRRARLDKTSGSRLIVTHLRSPHPGAELDVRQRHAGERLAELRQQAALVELCQFRQQHRVPHF